VKLCRALRSNAWAAALLSSRFGVDELRAHEGVQHARVLFDPSCLAQVSSDLDTDDSPKILDRAIRLLDSRDLCSVDDQVDRGATRRRVAIIEPALHRDSCGVRRDERRGELGIIMIDHAERDRLRVEQMVDTHLETRKDSTSLQPAAVSDDVRGPLR
jgi:hypothetical protein